MACEYIEVAEQDVGLNAPILLDSSIPCGRGYVYHEDGTGIFILKGAVNNPCNRFAHYQVTFNGNVSIPTDGAITPIAVALTVGGEARTASKAVFTPTAVEPCGGICGRNDRPDSNTDSSYHCEQCKSDHQPCSVKGAKECTTSMH